MAGAAARRLRCDDGVGLIRTACRIRKASGLAGSPGVPAQRPCRGASVGGWGRSSPMLHMGEKDRCGEEAAFPQDHALSRWLSCSVVGLPCALRGVCAHGSGTVAAVETSFPHDSGVSASAESMRMCSNHRPGTRGPQLRDHPRRIATSKTLEVSQMHAGGITLRLEIGPGGPSAVERSAALKARESLTLPRDGSDSNRPRRGTGPTSAGEGALRGRLPLAGPAAPLTAPSAPGCVLPPAPR